MTKTCSTAIRIPNTPELFGSDPCLAPYKKVLQQRWKNAETLLKSLGGFDKISQAHKFYGLHRKGRQWVFREWAPGATKITLTGDFCNWQILREYEATPIGDGNWELRLPGKTLRNGEHYAMEVQWPGGKGLRLPAYVRQVEQNLETNIFSAIVQDPQSGYEFRYCAPPPPEAPLIYEAHIGIATEELKVGSFREFTAERLPAIAGAGYNTIQLMAIQAHPYYGSFGYHVANFFAIADRFGTPDEFKQLVDEAHRLGLRVIIDWVHSHAVRNEAEGLSRIDGTRYAYFHDGPRGEHQAWDSLCFNYSKPEVLRFLLSNCRYFLEEYHIDGFRFDGVTSMLYYHHGLNHQFSGYEEYFGSSVDEDAVTYLTIANKLIHHLRPDAVTVAEDVSGMPGLAAPAELGGIGFDYRMAMGVTDIWFKMLDIPDEQWNIFWLYGELINRRKDEKSISYVECHDQAIVGGKSAMFTMADVAMYDAMHINSDNCAVDRAMALHKIMRLLTAAAAGNGYLNFIGNEFGHPEWIDFPRKENNWSYIHARRQWSLSTKEDLRYRFLLAFDREITALAGSLGFYSARPQTVWIDDQRKILVFERNDYWFITNFHPVDSYFGYDTFMQSGNYITILDSDDPKFGGFGLRTPDQRYTAVNDRLKLYLPSRTILVLKRQR